jgi:hypothetical protein
MYCYIILKYRLKSEPAGTTRLHDGWHDIYLFTTSCWLQSHQSTCNCYQDLLADRTPPPLHPPKNEL